MRTQLYKLFYIISLALFCAGSIGTPVAQAFTLEQRKELELRTFYDATDLNLCADGSAASAGGGSDTNSGGGSGSGSATGKVYVIGDSITEGTSSQLTASLKGKGFSTVVISGKSSRQLRPGGGDLDGVGVFERDKAKWSDASTIIVELGTNNGVSGANIAKIVELAKTSKAKLYWVNIGVNSAVRTGAKIDTGPINKLLSDAAGKGGFSIIDWASVVKQHPEYIANDGLGVHPFTIKGRPGFADTVAAGAGGGSFSNLGSAVTNTASGSVTCSSAEVVSTTTLSGNDNAQKVWNFLICKGLSANQAAGMMGNMEAEAHFEPRLVEYGYPNSRGEVSRAGKPSSLDDNVPPNSNSKGQPGYGIVQWTSPNRKDGLRKIVASRGVKGSDLTAQLDYLWIELNGSYKRSTLDPIKATSSVQESTRIFLYNFENPANKERAMPTRLGFAQAILKQPWAKDGGVSCAGK